MEKGIKNADAVARKCRLALTRATNQSLEVAREEKPKREEMVKRRKTKSMVAKRWRARKRISLSSEEEENYKSDTRDETDPDQANNDKHLLQLWEGGAGASYKQQLN